MARPRKPRKCCDYLGQKMFKPCGLPVSRLDKVNMNMDELAALNLCDFELLSQEIAGARMGVSRGTIQRLVKSGRKKLLEVILQNKLLVIEE